MTSTNVNDVGVIFPNPLMIPPFGCRTVFIFQRSQFFVKHNNQVIMILEQHFHFPASLHFNRNVDNTADKYENACQNFYFENV